jgi:hypothetical protein
MNGAVAVLCDSCIELKTEIKWVISGRPDQHQRAPMSGLAGEHKHDLQYHPELRIH